MSESAKVLPFISIPPKSKHFRRGPADCVISYSIKDRVWNWKVTVHVEPQVFTGQSPSEAEAQRKVAEQLHAIGIGPKPK